MTERTDEELRKAYGDALEAYYPPGWPIDGTAQPTLLRAIYNLGRADQAAEVERHKAELAEQVSEHSETHRQLSAKIEECARLHGKLERLTRERDEARGNTERFRNSMYAVEQKALECQREADRLRARVAAYEALERAVSRWRMGGPGIEVENEHDALIAALAASPGEAKHSIKHEITQGHPLRCSCGCAYDGKGTVTIPGLSPKPPERGSICCDYGDECPGHASPDERPCGYEPPERGGEV